MKTVILGLALSTFVLASFAADDQRPAPTQPAPAAIAAKPASADKAPSSNADKSAASDDSCDACDSGSATISKKTFLSPRAKDLFGKKLASGS